MKKKLVLLSMVLVLLLSFYNSVYALSYTHTDTSQADFSTGTYNNTAATTVGNLELAHPYRVPITINNTVTALTDYQVGVTLNTAALVTARKMRSDGGDVRFYDSDTTTPLNYYLEAGTINTANTKFWVKVPSIPGNSSKTIYITYGDQNLTSQSSGVNTFDYFQDPGDLDTFVTTFAGTYPPYPTGNYHSGYITDTFEVWSGADIGLMKIPSSFFPSYITSSTVNSVKLSIYRYADYADIGTPGTMTTYFRTITSNWDPLTVTGNTVPSRSATNLASDTIQSYSSGAFAYASWANLDITTWYNGWKSNPTTNYGISVVTSSPSGYFADYYGVEGLWDVQGKPWYVTVTYNTDKKAIIETNPIASRYPTPVSATWRTRKSAATEPTITLGTETSLPIYVSSGNFISSIANIASLSKLASSRISWNQVLNGQTVTVQANVSTNGGTTWNGWQNAVNGQAIPGIVPGMDMSNTKMQYRVLMSTTDINITPQLNDITINVVYDSGPPTGTVVINQKLDGTGSQYANSSPLTLTLNATDDSGQVSSMYISTNSTLPASPAWEPYATTKSWPYTGTDGPITLYSWFMDAAGNVSAPASATITFDKTPTTGTVKINNGDPTTSQGTVTLSFTKNITLADINKIIISNDNFTTSQQFDYSNTINGWQLDPSSANPKTVSAKYLDWAGNTSAPFSASITYTAPVNNNTGGIPLSFFSTIAHNQIITASGQPIVVSDPYTPVGTYTQAQYDALNNWHTFIDGDIVKYRLEFNVADDNTANSIKDLQIDFHFNDYFEDAIDLTLNSIALEQYKNGGFQVIKDTTSTTNPLAVTRLGRGRYVVTIGTADDGQSMFAANHAGKYAIEYTALLKVRKNYYDMGETSTTIRNDATFKVFASDSYGEVTEPDRPSHKNYIVTKISRSNIRYQ